TPITDPAVMVMASHKPKERFNPPELLTAEDFDVDCTGVSLLGCRKHARHGDYFFRTRKF
ncbi:MAG TPA: hypothetical protein DCL74_04420, partial [Succinivibrionaceae bacterium]|nr:hypothetical protein [Succinivibrionaceae bacterium]